MYIKRAAEDAVLEVTRTFPVLLVCGPRQTGKTTLLRHLAEENRKYVTLDDIQVRTLAKSDPKLFLQRYAPPILIDEIQYAPELLPYIKIHVDESRRNGEFWLTGSQTFSMMKNVSESLAGRVGIINLLGLSQSEIAGIPSRPFTTKPEELIKRLETAKKKTLKETFSAIFRGSMPAVWVSPDIDHDRYYMSYVSTYLQRDINDLTQVADQTAFYNFLVAAAARTGRMVVYDDLAKDAGISAPTAKRWLSLLVSSNIVALVQPYHNNILKRVVKAPVMHFLDTGLCAYLLRWESPETLERGAMAGNFFESYVFAEIYKSYLNAGKVPPVYYYRDTAKREIDLLLYSDNTLQPIEVKKSASPDKSAVKNFSVLQPKESGNFPDVSSGAVVCLADDLLPLDEKNWIVPAWLI